MLETGELLQKLEKKRKNDVDTTFGLPPSIFRT